MPLTHTNIVAVHMHDNSGLATSLRGQTSIVSCQKYKQNSLNRWAYVQDTL